MSPIQQMLLGVGAVATKTYVDDVFSTFLYTGNGSARSLNNGIDLSGEGGLTWLKGRSVGYDHALQDTVQGTSKYLKSSSDQAPETGVTDFITSFNNNGFSLGTNSDINNNGTTYSSWSFRKAPGFFDVVTYTGNGSNQNISHSLGCVPGCIMVKRLDATKDWCVYHRSIGNSEHLELNNTDAQYGSATRWNATDPTASVFSVGDNAQVNTSSGTYVAYLFAGGESTAATARSVDFDGSGDYLLTGSSSNFTMGTGDFTIEGWFKKTNDSDNDGLFQITDDSDGLSDYESNSLALAAKDSGFHTYAAGSTQNESTTFKFNGQWAHVAMVRSSGVTKVYGNGIERMSFTDTYNYNGTYLAIGGYAHTGLLYTGKVSNFRVVKGTAVYTSSFKPPTEPLTSISGTVLLCCNNSSVTGTTTGSISSNGDPTASTDSPFDDPAGFVFGENEDQGIIKCGSYVGNTQTDGPDVFLGWEPQYLMIKNAGTSGSPWQVWDSMRGVVTGGNDEYLSPNNSDMTASYERISFTPTGFKLDANSSYVNESGKSLIYVAIRRADGYVGKLPELGTDVLSIGTRSGSSSNALACVNTLVDFSLIKNYGAGEYWAANARLTGNYSLKADANNSQLQGALPTSGGVWDRMLGHLVAASNGATNSPTGNMVDYGWKRYAGFDVVTYKGDDFASGRNIPHSMNKAPEMMWVKDRSASENWYVYHKGHNGGSGPEHWFTSINTDGVEQDHGPAWADTVPTSTHFTVGGDTAVNKDDDNYIAMLFASVDGISKVGSYTGTGSDLDLDLGFTCRFLIIKRTDSSGHWMVFDSVRGINSGNEYFLRLNESDAQTAWTQADWVDPITDGIRIVSADADVNTNTGKYIYYAHA